MIHEFSGQGSFVTLTYRDDELPLRGSLVKDHVQRYIKMVRKDVKKAFRYYFVGEYGDLGGRPHYHGIILGLGVDEEALRDRWSRGFVHIDRVCIETINYCTSYINKKLYGKAAEAYGDRIAPFALMSKGMGLSWLNENQDHVLVNMGVRYRGKIVRAPRYYMKRLAEVIPEQYKEDVARKRSAARDDVGLEGAIELERRDREARWQRDVDLEWKRTNVAKGKL